ncbi:MAG: DNA polymerase III subunit delta [Nitrospiraceae bacterium]|nr:DNA polymerase III subunit delta [Nitrospiraceae bacterium]
MGQTLASLELPQALGRAGLAPIYAVVGEEDYLRDRAVAALRNAVLGDETPTGFNDDVFHGDESAVEDVLACAAEIPVFATRRVVVFKTLDKLAAREGEKLLPYLAEPNETTTLVLVATKFDGRLKWTQALTKHAVVVDCAPLREAQVAGWIKQEAGTVGVRLDDEATQLLKEVAGESLYGVRRELEKLAAYVPADRAAQAADVELLRGTEAGASVFDLTAAIGARDHGRALRILARNVENGEAPLRILGALVWQYRRLWKVKDQLAASGRDGDAARTLRMDPARVRTFLGQFSDGHMVQAFQWFMETDGRLKGGSGSSPVRVMEGLLLQLCSRPAPQQITPGTGRTTPPAQRPAGARPLSNVRTITRGKQPGR